ncbi:hypothetical protein Taro_048757 [Colocasia esculenta]|uniref:Protein kinase domain-containing protein n=1 Tax=Colocasia esculenta TaxID=4460 RepID=A0A843X940_COLES|nr:hypothetical protein [Colocasia esculenta]
MRPRDLGLTGNVARQGSRAFPVAGRGRCRILGFWREFVGVEGVKADPHHLPTKTPFKLPSVTAFAGLTLQSVTAPAVSDLPFLAKIPPIYKQHGKHFVPQGEPSAIPILPEISKRGLLSTMEQPSRNLSHLAKPSTDRHSAPSFAVSFPPTSDDAPANFGDSSVPSASAQPPLSSHSPGISFSDADVSKMNASLTSYSVQIAGGYRLLNLTWFKPLAPSPAPSLVVSPMALPPSTSSRHASNKDDNGEKSPKKIVSYMLNIDFTVKPSTTDSVSVEGSLPHPTSTRFLAYEELKEATRNFEPTSVLGEGGFGRVFKGVLSDGTPVAIKKLTSGGHQGDKEFLVEVEMLSRLHHRNLVKLVGYYSSRESSQNLLCYELVPNGSLESWLHGPLGANCPLDWDPRMKIALDAARGLAYLHEDSQPCVIHRDFKASNILLENDFHAKVSDFGLAKQAPEGRANYLSTRVMGTFGYVAPEYAMTGHLLVKSDVYSYGVVLLELLTGRKPVDMSQPSGQENLVTWARPILRDKDRLEELADPRLAGKYPKDDFVRVCTIAAACVAPEASQRPTMGEVVQSLKMVQHPAEYQESATPSTARPNLRQSSTTYESDGTSSMFSSGPFSGLSLFDNDNIARTAVYSEDLHEGR